jgi:dTDP-4-amino-4,6-dideoxygalactose transaminase
VLGSGEGGIVVFGGEESAACLRAWTNFGFRGSREAQVVGLNAKVREIEVAYVHAALDAWGVEREQRASAGRFVRAPGQEFDLDVLESTRDGIDSYWIVRFPDAATCDRAEAALAVERIEARRRWPRGCHRMPAYRGLESESLRVTEVVAGAYLGLPFFCRIEDEYAERLHEGLQGSMGAARVTDVAGP